MLEQSKDIRVKHKKSGKLYYMLDEEIINCTNENVGQSMILYTNGSLVFVREKTEFYEKFEVMEE